MRVLGSFQLAMDTLAFGYMLPVIRAHWGLSPVRTCPCWAYNKKWLTDICKPLFCGERGIRTPGPVKINGFQDRRIRPLCHLSSISTERDLLPLVVVPFCKGLQRYEYFRNLQIIFHFFLLLSRRTCIGRAKDRLLHRLHSCQRS